MGMALFRSGEHFTTHKKPDAKWLQKWAGSLGEANEELLLKVSFEILGDGRNYPFF